MILIWEGKMSNYYNDQIADRIIDEVEKLHFINEREKQLYFKKWYQAVLESETNNIFNVKPPIYSVKPASQEWLDQQEQKFLDSFSD